MTLNDITSVFEDKLRVRVCGIAINKDSILLIDHSGLNKSNNWWAPPGGGVELGETLKSALIREFQEETGLLVEVQEQLFITEYLEAPLHAIEVFFHVKVISGRLAKGIDPELAAGKQSIKALRYVTFEELALIDKKEKHQCLFEVFGPGDILSKKGYLPNQHEINK